MVTADTKTHPQTAVDAATLEIEGLHASVEGKQILKGIDLTVRQGEVHALMGPNGSGKSTLANVLLGVEDDMVRRYVNQGFSGGEKKKNEVLQLAVLEPEIAVLDETDSGLDIDSLRAVATGVDKLIGPDLGVLLITHYQRILNYIAPDHVHVMMGGRIVKSGGPELAHELEEKGYEGVRTELGIEASATAAE